MPGNPSGGRLRSAAVDAMLGATSVALVGASARPDSFGARMITEAERSAARMHLVNPRYDDINGMACAPSLAALGEQVDLVLLGVPDAALRGELHAAAQAGAKGAVVFGSAHLPGLREDIAAIAKSAGMALCGGGCMGFVNNVIGLRALGYLEPDPLPAGGVCLVTHSGSAFTTILRSRRRFGFRLAVSSGQELVTDTADYVDYALDDPETTMIALLLETPRAVGRLRSVLYRAAEQNVPVVILPVGLSPRGAAMVAAHSGSLAGDDAGWQAFCSQTGAIRVRDIAELCDTVELFEAGRRPRPGARGIATIHDSGAERALCADLAHEIGVEFAPLGDTTLGILTELLDDGLAATNPLDIWGTGADPRELTGRCLATMMADPAVAVTALAVDLVTEFDGDTSYPDAVRDVAAVTHEPLAVLASVSSAIDPPTAQLLRDNGIPVLEATASGLVALGHLARWPLPRSSASHRPDGARQARWTHILTSGMPDAASAFALLADYGIPVPSSAVANGEPQLMAAAQRIGFPVVLKTTGADHKSDVGGVVLDIGGPTALGEAYREMARRLGSGVSVHAMVPPGVEVSVGVVRDDNFGPLVVVAAGGTLVELVADRAVACPPITTAGALELLRSLRIATLLGGWRGDSPMDIDALAGVIVGLAQLATELGDVVDAVEANPVICSPTGAIAVDALVLTRGQKIE